MEMKITIRGASDDLIEIEGDIKEEFNHYNDDEPAYLAVSDGTLLAVRYGGDGRAFWRITPLFYGAAAYSKREATDEDKDYSDVVTLQGEIKWIAIAKGYAKK